MEVIGAAIQVKNESTGFQTGSITNEKVNIPSSSSLWALPIRSVSRM